MTRSLINTNEKKPISNTNTQPFISKDAFIKGKQYHSQRKQIGCLWSGLHTVSLYQCYHRWKNALRSLCYPALPIVDTYSALLLEHLWNWKWCSIGKRDWRKRCLQRWSWERKQNLSHQQQQYSLTSLLHTHIHTHTYWRHQPSLTTILCQLTDWDYVFLTSKYKHTFQAQQSPGCLSSFFTPQTQGKWFFFSALNIYFTNNHSKQTKVTNRTSTHTHTHTYLYTYIQRQRSVCIMYGVPFQN